MATPASEDMASDRCRRMWIRIPGNCRWNSSRIRCIWRCQAATTTTLRRTRIRTRHRNRTLNSLSTASSSNGWVRIMDICITHKQIGGDQVRISHSLPSHSRWTTWGPRGTLIRGTRPHLSSWRPPTRRHRTHLDRIQQQTASIELFKCNIILVPFFDRTPTTKRIGCRLSSCGWTGTFAFVL